MTNRNVSFIISDTGPILNFLFLKRIDLLNNYCISNKILIPMKVYEETIKQISKYPDKLSIDEFKKLNVHKFEASKEDCETMRITFPSLHDGEVEALAFANKFIDGSLIILDDKDARDSADVLRIKKTGTIGILKEIILEEKVDKKETELFIQTFKENKRHFNDRLYNRLIQASVLYEILKKNNFDDHTRKNIKDSFINEKPLTVNGIDFSPKR